MTIGIIQNRKVVGFELSLVATRTTFIKRKVYYFSVPV